MKFVGEGYLLSVSTYEKDGKSNFKYSFIVGDMEDGYIENATVQSCLSDHELLTGKEKLMTPVKVEVVIRTFREKVDGKYVDVTKPVYRLVDLNEVK